MHAKTTPRRTLVPDLFLRLARVTKRSGRWVAKTKHFLKTYITFTNLSLSGQDEETGLVAIRARETPFWWLPKRRETRLLRTTARPAFTCAEQALQTSIGHHPRRPCHNVKRAGLDLPGRAPDLAAGTERSSRCHRLSCLALRAPLFPSRS